MPVKQKYEPKRLTQSPINERKLKGINHALSNLPKNTFSKIIVIICLITMLAIIVASFVFIALGFDPSAITTPGLCAVTGELGLLSLKRIFARQEAVETILLNEVQRDLNDGQEYPIDYRISPHEEAQEIETNGVTNITINNVQPQEPQEEVKVEDTQQQSTTTQTQKRNVVDPKRR